MTNIGDAVPYLPQGVKRIREWYARATIDYTDLYVKLYVAYNAWYREVTGVSNDRHAMSQLKKRFIIWDDYCHGRTMGALKEYMSRLADLTQQEPLQTPTLYWNGEVLDAKDWRSLIEYWYAVRCLVVHGAEVKPSYIWLAYETLFIFMTEIVTRIQTKLLEYDPSRLKIISAKLLEETSSSRSPRFQRLQQDLYRKYIAYPDIWQVDMQRTKK